MPHFKVSVKSLRTETFYVQAEKRSDVVAFMEDNPEWAPGDSGLVESIDESEVDYEVTESQIEAGVTLRNGHLEWM